MAVGLPPGIDLAANQQPRIIGSVAATWALATIALVLRFYCRRLSKAGFWWDDYLMIPAYIFTSIVSWVTMTWMIQYGFGKHIYVQPPTDIPKAVQVFLKSLFIAEICYTGTIAFAKYSILLFYWRLFHMNTFVRWSVIVLAGIVTMWCTAVFLIVVTQCRPLRGFWDKTVPAQCTVDSYKFFYGNSVPNIITDALLIAAPLPAIWTLHLQLKQKISLSVIFCLGFFVTGVSITRLIHLVNLNIADPDVTWVFRYPQIWTCVELNIAVVCACLAQLRPLLMLITTGSATTLPGSSGKANSSRSGGSSKRSFPFLSKGSYTDTEITESSSDNGQYAAERETRPLVPDKTPLRGTGYVELNDLEKGQTPNRRGGSGPGVWNVQVTTDWNVTSNISSR
ncbi:hypothetical protein HBI56_224330 [Parastagonospora nodorum]|nr:hypothetical protein HBH53_229950 [Parastagonospora nodorum]KAH3957915.1 hypothetical protein HBH51_218470 [Parastagonospora nodorum]KAH3993976.1 hypothetical protein HBI10_193290 [Parastagonospora nodorum]KAH4008575.1 hypothetical protein HBI13_232620 [Parastagonospora nodorum]KAH4013423.1 hypothetical protein HBI09_218190 [Parastagonospora nodorum]